MVLLLEAERPQNNDFFFFYGVGTIFMSVENDPFIGKQLGAYHVQGKLGEGGMARVYKAYHPRLRREVAIKIILSQIADREGFKARFEREAQVIASLEHPNIVSVYDFGEEGDITYLVMQYVGGGILRDLMHGSRPLSPAQTIGYTIQMARALHHAHQRGIVHRDVKPQNMLISSADRNHLLLSDFGIAKLYTVGEDPAAPSDMPTRAAEQDSSLTSVDQIIGTADYMAPEQVNGQPVDARTDVYALGVVLYQMLTGEVPFRSTTLRGLLFQQIYTTPPSVRTKNPGIPEGMEQIVNKAMAKAPGDRFASAEAMARALELANVNATNPLSGLGMSNVTTMTFPQSGAINRPSAPGMAVTSQSQSNSYSTHISPLTNPPGSPGLTSPSIPGNAPSTTGIARPVGQKRRLPLSYIIGAVVLIVSLVIFAPRLLSSFSGNPGVPTGAAQAFVETFQNNDRGWPAGSLNNGISTSTPAGGVYTVNVPYNTNTQRSQTTLPSPTKVGALPNNFTLSATIKLDTGGTGVFYGIAFHYRESDQTCYALVINNAGNYELLKCADISTPVYQGTFQTSGQTHTLKVKAQGSNYSFYIDDNALSLNIGGQTATTWNNNELQGGQLALFLSSQSSAGAQTAAYTISRVELSIG